MRTSATTALARLRSLRKPALTTGDAAAALRVSTSTASAMLTRLAASGLLLRVRRGLWSLEPASDPMRLVNSLTAPLPSYVSFYTALYLHGMISQIPQVIYVASLALPRQIRTQVGTFSIHRLSPRFFGGYETADGVPLATREKALLDTLYLVPARSRLFTALPEVEIPRAFDRKVAHAWLKRISEGPRRKAVEKRLLALLRRPASRSPASPKLAKTSPARRRKPARPSPR